MLLNINRLKSVIEAVKYEYRITQGEIADKLGYKTPYLSDVINGRKPISEQFTSKFQEVFPEINRTWLLTGEGEMLKEESVVSIKDDNTPVGKIIPLFDVEAAAGLNYSMSMEPVSRPVSMIEIGSLLKDSEVALRVYGNSMVPNYPAGCVVGLKPHLDSFIEPGSIYVVETEENRYLKRLYPNKEKSAFRCISDNHMIQDTGPMKGDFLYPEFEIPFSSVRKLFRVVGVIKRNIL